ncbi:MAG: hypothetical protein F4Y63_08585 [Chloroflexi bacterium]|nr:hypothetical protein [Chloroflexota bacterium]MYK61237.1 hypothetical protein [Chloroflexota bacterium]
MNTDFDDWLADESPQMREAKELAKRVSVTGNYNVVENGYAHDCTEPDKGGRAECCIEAGSEIQINPAPWQLMEGTARSVGKTVPELLGLPEDWNQDDDIRLSKKWKRPR